VFLLNVKQEHPPTYARTGAPNKCDKKIKLTKYAHLCPSHV
jgi:hypothetical protein